MKNYMLHTHRHYDTYTSQLSATNLCAIAILE